MSSVRTDPPPVTGLSTAEAERRRAAGQGNDVEIRAGRTYGRIVRDNAFNFINNLFYFLGILLLILGKPLDAFAVVFVIGANTVISLFQEIRAKRVMDKMAILLRPKADVLRDGQVVEIDPSLVVLGDVLRLEPGDQVVVDGPMVGEGRMEVDESLLTGESDLVTKHPGDDLMSGSFCMTGGGYYEAAQVGLDSFANKLTAKAKVFKRELTPLQRQVVQIVRILLIVVIVFEALVWIRNVIGGVPFVESVRMSTVILALIPNGLVLSIALTYALGAIRLLGKDVLVQQFNAVESLSNVDVLCTDKTGTLTSGVVTFEELAGLGADDARAARLLGAFSASTTDANRTIEALRTAFPAERQPAAHEAFFSSERKWSGLSFADGEARGTYVLGAPEILAPALGAGADWRGRADEWAARGLRVVMFAGRDKATAFSSDPDAPPVLPADLRALALICFSDELRPGVRGTLEEFSEAGIDVKIISGDNPKTVVALATQAGVHSLRRREGVDSYCDMVNAQAACATTTAGDAGPAAGAAGPGAAAAAAPSERALVAVSGAELAELSPEDFAAKADEAGIFGRVTPEQKQDLVEALRDRGRYVAMIGDGVNDVIALKQANVAVAMQGGSQAARSVGDLILMKDTFAPLPFAFREGQRIINGMNDILRIFMVRIGFKALMIAIVMTAGGFPFAPRQSALLSFFGATVPAIAFALWAQPGPTPKVGLFKLLARFVLPTVVFMAGIGTAVYLIWAIPAEHVVRTAVGTTEKELAETGYPPAMTALTVFACFAAIFLILLIVPPSKWWAGGAPVVRNDWRMVGTVGFLFACMAVVLAVPLGRTLFE
ncbi:MAG TPA: HAD-IC family P-type ATPase, partial [Thermoleophilia bacterium]